MTMYSLPQMFVAEHEAAAYLAQLLRCTVSKITPHTDGLDFLQPTAVNNACNNSVSILTGPPGTGKTTTVKRIVDSFQKAGLKKGIIACPTGKAAKRAFEVVNYDINTGQKRELVVEAVTTHRLLKWSYSGFIHNEHNQLDYDYIIVDEFPMMGIGLFASFLSSVKPGRTRIVLSGDQHQLPSVEPGNIARDLSVSGFVPTIELDHVFRQGANSGIVYNANRILRGESLCKTDPVTGEDFTDFFFVPRADEEKTFETVIDYICDKIPAKRELDSTKDIQALSPGKKSKVGTKSLNDALREKLSTGKMGKHGFKVGDKVINRVNNYDLDIVNGDVGVVTDSTNDGVKIDFGLGAGEIAITGKALSAIYLAYSYTVHASQGSEYPAVIMPVHKCHYQLLFRNLLYTGITRGKELTVVIGDPKAVNICIHKDTPQQRSTGFLAALRKYYKS